MILYHDIVTSIHNYLANIFSSSNMIVGNHSKRSSKFHWKEKLWTWWWWSSSILSSQLATIIIIVPIAQSPWVATCWGGLAVIDQETPWGVFHITTHPPLSSLKVDNSWMAKWSVWHSLSKVILGTNLCFKNEFGATVCANHETLKQPSKLCGFCIYHMWIWWKGFFFCTLFYGPLLWSGKCENFEGIHLTSDYDHIFLRVDKFIVRSNIIYMFFHLTNKWPTDRVKRKNCK